MDAVKAGSEAAIEIGTELEWMSLAMLSEMVKRRRVSPVEIVTALLARIDRYNGVLHSYITVCGEAALKAARLWAAWFPQRYYLEVQRAGHSDDEALTAATVRLAASVGLPVVATHPVQFLRRHEFRAHEAGLFEQIRRGHIGRRHAGKRRQHQKRAASNGTPVCDPAR